MAQQTAAPTRLAELVEEYDLAADAYDEKQKTVVVERDDSVCSVDGIQALAERNGYFVLATDASEVTLVAREDCEWKSAA